MDKLQWGNRKRLRRVKMKGSSLSGKSDGNSSGGSVVKKTITARVLGNISDKHTSKCVHALLPVPSPHRTSRSGVNENQKASILAPSPEKEDRHCTKRGPGELGWLCDRSKLSDKEENEKFVWPRLLISLSCKEKEEDFMIMKGCKLPQRPKKRAKSIQRTILAVSPGVWLSDLCQERYEVREKKTSKKKPRGLKAMGSMEYDSE